MSTDTLEDVKLPDRVSCDRTSPFHYPRWKKIGVKFNGQVIFNCAEYCVSEGWVRRVIPTGRNSRPKLERGRPVAVTTFGTVEPYWRY